MVCCIFLAVLGSFCRNVIRLKDFHVRVDDAGVENEMQPEGETSFVYFLSDGLVFGLVYSGNQSDEL